MSPAPMMPMVGMSIDTVRFNNERYDNVRYDI